MAPAISPTPRPARMVATSHSTVALAVVTDARSPNYVSQCGSSLMRISPSRPSFGPNRPAAMNWHANSVVAIGNFTCEFVKI